MCSEVSIDADSCIATGVRLYGGTRIGKRNRIDHGVVLGGDPQDLNFDPTIKTELHIGDDNQFREGCNVSRSSSPDRITTIGSNNLLMNQVHLGHDCVVGNNNVFTQSCAVGGHVHVGNRVMVAGLVAVHQFVRLGDYAMIAGLAKVVKDVAPFMLVDGNPARTAGVNVVGLRRAGFDAAARARIKAAYKLIFRSGISLTHALEKLEEQTEHIEIAQLVQFLRDSKRGITA